MYAIVFHYFHNNQHIPCQGSLSQTELMNVLEYIEKYYDVITPKEFIECVVNNYVFEEDEKVCLCFNCGLKSQEDIALPVLSKLSLKAFWMLNTKIFDGESTNVETYHHFRFYKYINVNDFYCDFFDEVEELLAKKNNSLSKIRASLLFQNYLGWSNYYTESDKLYKFLRDNIIVEDFEIIMSKLMQRKNYNPSEHAHHLWISKEKIAQILQEDHVVGLHTHSHPYKVDALSKKEQFNEYVENKTILEKITGEKIVSMSHPCNNYNEDTLNILRELGIIIGFRSDFGFDVKSNLELSSKDVSEIVKEMKEKGYGDESYSRNSTGT